MNEREEEEGWMYVIAGSIMEVDWSREEAGMAWIG